jgi:hypothetical protein
MWRRWGGLDGLLADLMAEHAAQEIAVPDEGNLDADLRALARGVVTSLRDPAIKAAFASMVAAAVQNRAAQEVLSRFLATRTAKMTVIISRAIQRGDLPPGTDAARVIRTVTALIYYRLFIAGGWSARTSPTVPPLPPPPPRAPACCPRRRLSAELIAMGRDDPVTEHVTGLVEGEEAGGHRAVLS